MRDFSLAIPHTFVGDVVNGRVVERRLPFVMVYPRWPLAKQDVLTRLKLHWRHQGFSVHVGRRAYRGRNNKDVVYDEQWCRLEVCWQRGFRRVRFNCGPGRLGCPS